MTVGDAGGKGGSKPPLTVAEATRLFEEWRAAEHGWVKAMAIKIAGDRGEVHGIDFVGTQLREPNVVGSVFNALARAGLIEPMNRLGVAEWRMGSATSRRASRVWRLTERGRSAYTLISNFDFPSDPIAASGQMDLFATSASAPDWA